MVTKQYLVSQKDKKTKDLVGCTFGLLTIMEILNIERAIRKCKCNCKCGNELIWSLPEIKRGKKTSCGCDGNKKSKLNGLSKTKLYRTWITMKNRCSKGEEWRNYKYYKGKGIQVCNEWDNSFILFMSWALQNGYKEGLVIDRKDSSKNYQPDNCRWVTVRENCYNRPTVKLTIDKAQEIRNKSGKFVDLAKEYNVSPSIIGLIKKNRIWIS